MVAEGAVRKIRGTLRQGVECHAQEHGIFCSGTPGMYKAPQHACAPHIARCCWRIQKAADRTSDYLCASQEIRVITPKEPQFWTLKIDSREFANNIMARGYTTQQHSQPV